MSVPYELVWLNLELRPALAERFFVADFRGELPFLVPQAIAERALAEPTSLDEEQLLHGLLAVFAERDEDGYLIARPKDTAVLLELFEILRQGFGFESFELMVLETSGVLRSRYGVQPSQACLSAGRLLVPGSHQIRADLLLDLWIASAGAADVGDHPLAVHYRRLIPELFTGLTRGAVPEPTYQLCAYLNLAARYLRDDFIEPGSLEEFLVDEVIEVVSDPRLKTKLAVLVEAVKADRKLSFADLDPE